MADEEQLECETPYTKDLICPWHTSEWFYCKACGKRAANFSSGFRGLFPFGAVVHEKPACAMLMGLGRNIYLFEHQNALRANERGPVQAIVSSMDKVTRRFIGDWFECAGCHLAAAYFETGVPDVFPAQTIVHDSKLCPTFVLHADSGIYLTGHSHATRIELPRRLVIASICSMEVA